MSKHSILLAALLAATQSLGVFAKPKQEPRIYTHVDEERQRKAEAKRSRKAAKRMKGKQ